MLILSVAKFFDGIWSVRQAALTSTRHRVTFEQKKLFQMFAEGVFCVDIMIYDDWREKVVQNSLT